MINAPPIIQANLDAGRPILICALVKHLFQKQRVRIEIVELGSNLLS